MTIEEQATTFAETYSKDLVEQAKRALVGTMAAMLFPSQAWESLEAEVSSRVKQVFLNGANAMAVIQADTREAETLLEKLR